LFRQRDVYYVQARRTLHLLDRGAVFATGGVAIERESIPIRPDVDRPGFTAHETNAGPMLGAGVEVELAPRLALRADAQFVMAGSGFFRGMVGVSVPLQPYPDRAAWRRERRPAAGEPFAGTRLGQRVWLTTTDGRVVGGDVADRSSSRLSILANGRRTEVAAADVRRLETTDRLRNGIVIGTLTGGLSGGVLGGWLGALLCETDDNCALVAGLVFGGIGAGIGALAGAVADSLHAGRRTLYERPAAGSSVVIVPMATRRGGGAVGIIRW
jgi:hypothetical protein